jgi:hypothetical protein
MGIDYKIKSQKNPQMYKEDDPNQYLTWAIKDIQWDKIFELLHINLGLLYNSSINYWCPEQVKDMYIMIKSINEDPYNLYVGWKKEELEDHMIDDIEEAKKLKEDISKLKEYFEYLVENEAYIEVF